MIKPTIVVTFRKMPMIAAMASRKAYLTLELGGTFCGCGEGPDAPEPENMKWFKERWAQSGKKLSMGKACIRFKKIEDLALDVIGEEISQDEVIPPGRDFEILKQGLDLCLQI